VIREQHCRGEEDGEKDDENPTIPEQNSEHADG
jgi:hypothetical protein